MRLEAVAVDVAGRVDRRADALAGLEGRGGRGRAVRLGLAAGWSRQHGGYGVGGPGRGGAEQDDHAGGERGEEEAGHGAESPHRKRFWATPSAVVPPGGRRGDSRYNRPAWRRIETESE